MAAAGGAVARSNRSPGTEPSQGKTWIVGMILQVGLVTTLLGDNCLDTAAPRRFKVKPNPKPPAGSEPSFGACAAGGDGT